MAPKTNREAVDYPTLPGSWAMTPWSPTAFTRSMLHHGRSLGVYLLEVRERVQESKEKEQTHALSESTPTQSFSPQVVSPPDATAYRVLVPSQMAWRPSRSTSVAHSGRSFSSPSTERSASGSMRIASGSSTSSYTPVTSSLLAKQISTSGGGGWGSSSSNNKGRIASTTKYDIPFIDWGWAAFVNTVPSGLAQYHDAADGPPNPDNAFGGMENLVLERALLPLGGDEFVGSLVAGPHDGAAVSVGLNWNPAAAHPGGLATEPSLAITLTFAGPAPRRNDKDNDDGTTAVTLSYTAGTFLLVADRLTAPAVDRLRTLVRMGATDRYLRLQLAGAPAHVAGRPTDAALRLALAAGEPLAPGGATTLRELVARDALRVVFAFRADALRGLERLGRAFSMRPEVVGPGDEVEEWVRSGGGLDGGEETGGGRGEVLEGGGEAKGDGSGTGSRSPVVCSRCGCVLELKVQKRRLADTEVDEDMEKLEL